MTHTSTEQPEALRLIEWFAESNGFNQGTKPPHKWVLQAEQELRRLHARVQELETGLKKANAQAEHFEREWYLRGDELEASQAQRVPLSDEQIEDLPVWKHFVGMLPAHWIEIARAIEAAHGITQEKQG